MKSAYTLEVTLDVDFGFADNWLVVRYKDFFNCQIILQNKPSSLFGNQIYNRKFANSFLREEYLINKINKCGHIKLQNDFSKQSYC